MNGDPNSVLITGGRYGERYATKENDQEETRKDHDGKAGGEERQKGPLKRNRCIVIPDVDGDTGVVHALERRRMRVRAEGTGPDPRVNVVSARVPRRRLN